MNLGFIHTTQTEIISLTLKSEEFVSIGKQAVLEWTPSSPEASNSIQDLHDLPEGIIGDNQTVGHLLTQYRSSVIYLKEGQVNSPRLSLC